MSETLLLLSVVLPLTSLGRGQWKRHRLNGSATNTRERECEHCTCTSNVKLKTELESRMVKRCVAAGCSNTNADGVSLFKFPKDEKLRALWIKQVRRFRAEWTCTEYSVMQWTFQRWMLRGWIEVSCRVWNEKDKKAESRCYPKYIYQVLGDEWNPRKESLTVLK